MDISSELVLNYLKIEGAVHAGIATPKILAGGPPSTDLSCVMPSAKAAVVFALPLKLDATPVYLAKKDRLSFETDYIRKSSLGNGIAVKLANFLATKGHPRESGVIVQNEDGTLEAVAPEEAHERMAAMEPERRAMYEGEIEPVSNPQEELIQKKKFHHKL